MPALWYQIKGTVFGDEFTGDRLGTGWFWASDSPTVSVRVEGGGMWVDTGLVEAGDRGRVVWFISPYSFSPQSFTLSVDYMYELGSTGQTVVALIFYEIFRSPRRLMMDLLGSFPGSPPRESIVMVGGDLTLPGGPHTVVVRELSIPEGLPLNYQLQLSYNLPASTLTVTIPQLGFVAELTVVVFDAPRGVALAMGAVNVFSDWGRAPVAMDSRLYVRLERVVSTLPEEGYFTNLTPFQEGGVIYDLGATTSPAVVWVGPTGMYEVLGDGAVVPADGVHDVAVALIRTPWGRHTVFTPLTPEDLLTLPNVEGVDAYETYFFAQGYGRDYRVNLGVPPDTILLSYPPEATIGGVQVFTFTSDDPLALFECRWNLGLWESCESPLTVTVAVEGMYRLDVRAVSLNGDRDPTPAQVIFSVFLPPETRFLELPPLLTNRDSALFSFEAEGSHPPFSFRCSLDGGPEFVCESPYSTGPLTEGRHTFSVYAVDSRGVGDLTPVSYGWEIDLTPPRTTLTETPPSTTDIATVSFAFVANEPSEQECSVDGGPWYPCTSPVIVTAVTFGDHSFSVRSIDRAGNIEDLPPIYRWYYGDIIPPETVILFGPPPLTFASEVTFTFEANEPARFFCSLTGLAYVECESPFVATSLLPGTYIFRVYAVDLAGNPDPTPAQYVFRRVREGVVPVKPTLFVNGDLEVKEKGRIEVEGVRAHAVVNGNLRNHGVIRVAGDLRVSGELRVDRREDALEVGGELHQGVERAPFYPIPPTCFLGMATYLFVGGRENRDGRVVRYEGGEFAEEWTGGVWYDPSGALWKYEADSDTWRRFEPGTAPVEGIFFFRTNLRTEKRAGT